MKLHDARLCKSRWGHEVLYHEEDVHSFKIPLLLFVVAILVLPWGFSPCFSADCSLSSRQGLLEYGALVG